MIALRLAWRNLRRNKRRTILTTSALTIGLTIMIFTQGMLDGVDQQSIDNLIKYDLSHIKVFAPRWLDEDFPDLDYVIAGSDSLLEVIRKIDGVASATQRLELTGMLIYGREEIFTRIIGVDPLVDRNVFETLNAVVAGESIISDKPVVLIGDRLAEDIKVSVGDLVTLFVRSAPGALNPRILPVAGIVSTGHPKIDQLSVYIPLSLAREITLLPRSATEIAIQTRNLSKLKKTSRLLATVVPDFAWRKWNELADDFLQFAKMKRIGSGIMIGIITLVAAVGLGNTMIISVHERTREIGTLKALGFSRRLISAIFLVEGMLIGIIACIIAVIIGGAVVFWVGSVGISLAAYEGMDIGYPVRDAMYPTMKAGNLLFTTAFGMALAILASWGAARRASRGEIIRSLREGML